MNLRRLALSFFSQLGWKGQLLVVVVGVCFLVYQQLGEQMVAPPQTSDVVQTEFIYTRHARCRMDCREISKPMIQEVWSEGKLNRKKSRLSDKPCPSVAMEDRVAGRNLRVVFAKCEPKVKVVTAIDLDRKFYCECQ